MILERIVETQKEHQPKSIFPCRPYLKKGGMELRKSDEGFTIKFNARDLRHSHEKPMIDVYNAKLTFAGMFKPQSRIIKHIPLTNFEIIDKDARNFTIKFAYVSKETYANCLELGMG